MTALFYTSLPPSQAATHIIIFILLREVQKLKNTNYVDVSWQGTIRWWWMSCSGILCTGKERITLCSDNTYPSLAQYQLLNISVKFSWNLIQVFVSKCYEESVSWKLDQRPYYFEGINKFQPIIYILFGWYGWNSIYEIHIIPGICCDVNENFPLLGCYTA
jgi:hypothetical protein